MKTTKMMAIVAVLAFGMMFGLGTTAVAAYIAPGDPLIPVGLVEGDTFHMVFVTSTTTTAESSDISTYNTFVTSAANFEGSLVKDKGWAWYAICSTATVDAKTNTSTTGIGYPIYLVAPYSGERFLYDNYIDLWDATDGKMVRVNQFGGALGAVSGWTGSNGDGTASTMSMGNSPNVTFAEFYKSGGTEWITGHNKVNTTPYPMIAMSEELTIGTAVPVPEPASAGMVVLGLAGLLIRRRKA